MKRLNIPSVFVGLFFGVIGGAFVYLFVPPPSTASADSCDYPSADSIAKEVNRYSYCATIGQVTRVVELYCSN